MCQRLSSFLPLIPILVGNDGCLISSNFVPKIVVAAHHGGSTAVPVARWQIQQFGDICYEQGKSGSWYYCSSLGVANNDSIHSAFEPFHDDKCKYLIKSD